MAAHTMHPCSCGNAYAVRKAMLTNRWDEYSDCPACGKRHYHPPGGGVIA